MNVNDIVDIGKETIDLSAVVRVSPIGGDSSWLRYSIFFANGYHIEVYENAMPREKFIKLWKQSKDPDL